mgnify:CR=1 FL=1
MIDHGPFTDAPLTGPMRAGPIVGSVVFGPRLSSLGATTEGDNINVTLNGLTQDGTFYYGLIPAGDPTPTHNQIKAGNYASDTAKTASGNFAVTVAGTMPVTPGLPATLDGDYDLVGGIENGNGQSPVYKAPDLAITTVVASGPVVRSAGPVQGTGGAQTVSFPTHATGDILCIAFISRFANGAPAAPTGMTLTQNVGQNGGGEDLNLAIYTKTAASAAEADVSFADNGAVNMCFPFVIQDAASVASLATAIGDTTGITISGGTTSAANSLVVEVIGNRISGQTTNQLSSVANAGLDSFDLEGFGQQTAPQGGGGFNVYAGGQASAAAVSNTTATLASVEDWAAIRLEFVAS